MPFPRLLGVHMQGTAGATSETFKRRIEQHSRSGQNPETLSQPLKARVIAVWLPHGIDRKKDEMHIPHPRGMVEPFKHGIRITKTSVNKRNGHRWYVA